jgi:hypothetical protein
MHIDLATVHWQEALFYFEEYRDSVFANCLVKVKETIDE